MAPAVMKSSHTLSKKGRHRRPFCMILLIAALFEMETVQKAMNDRRKDNTDGRYERKTTIERIPSCEYLTGVIVEF